MTKTGCCVRLAVVQRDASAQQPGIPGSRTRSALDRSLETLRASRCIKDVFAGIPTTRRKHGLLLVIQKFRDGKVATPPTIASLHVVDLKVTIAVCISVRKWIEPERCRMTLKMVVAEPIPSGRAKIAKRWKTGLLTKAPPPVTQVVPD